ncbi:MAG: type II secretion system protein [Candidatus Paceibacterota bacterium]|jgi:prepilin-type N-terminal cleavage/methylation domain-containing protein
MKKLIKNQKGLTLVETLVSIAIFGIISMILVNIFVIAIKTQNRIIETQTVTEEADYTIEYMTSKIRMATKDETGNCVGSIANYGLGSNSIKFLSYDVSSETYKCREFSLEDNTINEKISTNSTSFSFGLAVPLTSSSITVDNLSFSVAGTDGEYQTKVTTLINMAKGTSSIKLQTTVSKRELDL